MNVERIEKLIDFLAQEHVNFKFDIDTFYVKDMDCGTIGCIGGATIWLFGDESTKRRDDLNFNHKMIKYASSLLGLEPSLGETLFVCYPAPSPGRMEAIGALRNILDGKEPW